MKKRNLKEYIENIIRKSWLNAEAFDEDAIIDEIEKINSSIDWLEDD